MSRRSSSRSRRGSRGSRRSRRRSRRSRSSRRSRIPHMRVGARTLASPLLPLATLLDLVVRVREEE